MVVGIEKLKDAIRAQKLQCTLARSLDGIESEWHGAERERLVDLEAQLQLRIADATRYVKSNEDLLAD
jgi:hypothetical protein